MGFDKFFIHLIEDKCISDTKLARKLGVTKQTINNWKRGHSKPRRKHMYHLERLYGVKVPFIE